MLVSCKGGLYHEQVALLEGAQSRTHDLTVPTLPSIYTASQISVHAEDGEV